MNLEDVNLIKELDPLEYYQHWLTSMGERFLQGWQDGQNDGDYIPERPVWFIGLGSFNLAVRLLEAYIGPRSLSPVYFGRETELPDWVLAQKPLIVLVGGVEESLGIKTIAKQRNIQIVFINPMEEDVYYTIGALLGISSKLQIIPDLEGGIQEAAHDLYEQYEKIKMGIPSATNPAKRQAGQLMGRWSVIAAAEHLAPAAQYWKRQLNLLSKFVANAENIEQMVEETIEGICFPEFLPEKMIILFIEAGSYQSKNRTLIGQLKQGFMIEGINTDIYLAKGRNSLAHLLTVLQFGDFMAYYLAIAYRVDPSTRLMKDQWFG